MQNKCPICWQDMNTAGICTNYKCKEPRKKVVCPPDFYSREEFESCCKIMDEAYESLKERFNQLREYSIPLASGRVGIFKLPEDLKVHDLEMLINYFYLLKESYDRTTEN